MPGKPLFGQTSVNRLRLRGGITKSRDRATLGGLADDLPPYWLTGAMQLFKGVILLHTGRLTSLSDEMLSISSDRDVNQVTENEASTRGNR